MVLSILKKLKRWKSLISFMSRPKNQKKIIILKCCLLLLYTTANQFLTRMWQYDNWWWPAQWLDWEEAPTCVLVAQSCLTLCDPLDCSLQGSSVHGIFQMKIVEWVAISFSRGSSRLRDQTQVSCIVGRLFTTWASREASLIHTKLAPKTGHGHRWAVCCPSDPLQLSKFQWKLSIWEVWSENQWDAPKLQCVQLASVNRKGTILLYDNTQPHVSQPTLQKLNELAYEGWPHLPCSPHLSPADYHFFKHLDNFLQGKQFHKPAGGRNCFPRVHWILKNGFLHYRNIG